MKTTNYTIIKRQINYIVYNTDTLNISDTFKWFGKDIMDHVKSDSSLKWLNVTHPKNINLLASINKVNDTMYS